MDVLERRAGNSRSTKPYAAKTEKLLWDMGHRFASSSGIRIRLEAYLMAACSTRGVPPHSTPVAFF
jgi:hypothetical protein